MTKMKISEVWSSFARLNAIARILFAGCTLIVLFMFYLVAIYFHSWWVIDNYLRSDKWTLPSTLYAEAPVLRVGMSTKTKTLVDHFRRLNYHKHLANEPIKQDGTYAVFSNGVLFQKRQLFSKQPRHHPIRVDIKSDRVYKIVDLSTSRSLEKYELEPIPIRSLFGKRSKKEDL